MTLLVVVMTGQTARVAEALRAAVGLCLRGDEVRVLLRHQPPPDPRIARALATLRELGFDVRCPSDAAAIDGAVRAADKIEVWT